MAAGMNPSWVAVDKYGVVLMFLKPSHLGANGVWTVRSGVSAVIYRKLWRY